MIIALSKQVNTIMAEVDVDHNGKMDLSEFILMMHKQVSTVLAFPSIKEEIRSAALTQWRK